MLRTALVSLVSLCLAASLAVVAPSDADAHATSSVLAFEPGDPLADPGGRGTRIEGAATVTPQGWLDVSGRAAVTTPDRSNLNPGFADFSFGARLALTRGVMDANIMQKGFFAQPQWRLSLHNRRGEPVVSCRVRGTNGAVHAFSSVGDLTADGEWQTVMCRRSGSTVEVIVDGVVVGFESGPIGLVANTEPYLLASKGFRPASDDRDWYQGLLDDATVVIGSESSPRGTSMASVTPTVETEPVRSGGDAADDPAIWVHPTDPARSLIIGNDKGGGLEVYDLDGRRIQRITEGFFGNVDVRQRVSLPAGRTDVVAVARSGLRFYTVDPDTRRLVSITDSESGSVAGGGEGVCLYRSPSWGICSPLPSTGAGRSCSCGSTTQTPTGFWRRSKYVRGTSEARVRLASPTTVRAICT